MRLTDDSDAAVILREPRPMLTSRELRLLEWLALGRTNVQFGQCAARSEKTVRNQLTALYSKLGAAHRAEAVALWLRRA